MNQAKSCGSGKNNNTKSTYLSRNSSPTAIFIPVPVYCSQVVRLKLPCSPLMSTGWGNTTSGEGELMVLSVPTKIPLSHGYTAPRLPLHAWPRN